MRWFLVLVAVALLAAAVYFLRSETRAPAALAADDAAAPAAAAPAELAAPRASEPTAPPAEPEPEPPAPERVAVEPAPAPPAAAPEEGARVHGRFVLPDGAPAAGVAVSLHGWPANSDRVREHGAPDDWQNPPPATTDADGRFELRLDPPQAFQFTMEGELAGYAAASWRWGRIDPDEDKDVGTVELARAGTVVARVVDADGRALREDWRVYADSARTGRGSGRDSTRVAAQVDPATGVARLEGVAPGATKLKAHSRIANWIDGPVVEVVAGQEVEAEIRYEGPDNSRRITVVTFSRPFHTVKVDEDAIWLTGPGGERRSEKIQGSSQSYAFDDLAPGVYTVGVDDPRFEPWTRTGVEPGARVDARLRCNAALEVEVVDAATGEPLEPYGLEIRLDGSSWRPNVFTLRERDEAAPPGGLYEGIPPMELSLLVEAEGYARLEQPVGELRPNETRAVELELARGTTLRGRVVEHDGTTPVPDAQVELLPVGEQARVVRPGSWSSADDLEVTVWTTTDADGRFALERVRAGAWSLHAVASSWLVASVEPLELVEGEQRAELELVLPPAGALEARLVVPDGASLDGPRFFLAPSAEPAVHSAFAAREIPLELRTDPDGGRAELVGERLPPGAARVLLRGPDVMLPYSFSGMSGGMPPELEVAAVELAAGRTTRVEIDARDAWPGAIRVRVTREGAPLAGHVVEANGGPDVRRSTTGAVTDADGVALVEHALPGEWTLLVRPVEGEWSFQAPAPVTVAPARETALDLDVLLVPGSVQLVDAESGVRLAERAVLLYDASGRGSRHTTDEAGRLSLELAPGTYTLRDAGGGSSPFGGAAATLEWGASGPLAPQVALGTGEE